MKRILFWVVLSFFLFAVSPHSESSQGRNSGLTYRPKYVPGEVLVRYRQGVSASNVREFQRGKGIQTKREFGITGIHQEKLPQYMTVEEALEIYRNNPDVEYAEPNYLLHAAVTIPQ